VRLFEFQAKRILAEYGIPVPQSTLLRSPSNVADIPFPAVLKVQVPVGGRGKAGGIRMANSAVEARALAEELFASEIIGHPVRAILAEHKAKVDREMYVAVLFDRHSNRPMVMASAVGGVDIEQVARQNPERIVRKQIDPFIGLQPHTTRFLGRAVQIEDIAGFGAILEAMYTLLCAYDATLVEINPLAETPDGLVALDAKIVLDDKAAYRHASQFARLREEQKGLGRVDKTWAEHLAEERGITYVLLDGDIGLIADGAGTGMLTLDLIQDAGGHAGNFCEMGGLANASIMCQAIEVVLANPRVKALLISLIGGLTRMDEMAVGIVRYLEQHEAAVPLVVRMCGTQEEVGKATLQAVGIEPFDDLLEAVQRVVDLARAQERWPS
jgi:succinyl-CoA synthetase beta subunit